ncbi:glycosyltransferase family 2 protein [Seonamhaeicola maritimus]|uniref:Glycosyltransferase n=1 Tax=Seonamhaeicola maritimus TaxID=2591822 RepID=A0A5C7GDB7_9FLAO|nr:glycosyltransferase [Seonamhaeicola maritimus]TXG34555.1 glycosyltransferase [Seonamhaeicola maritimus]
MLSILIPTYNYNAYPLISKLEKQAFEAGIKYEIICIDDGSHSSFNLENKKINQLKYSKFFSLNTNAGLSNNRNELAKVSNYDYLLFIDSDSSIIDESFIIKYVEYIGQTDVIYGGRIHPKTVNSKRKLRWKYGVYREDRTFTQRNKHPYKCILFNNTLLKREVFNKIGFEESITQYGHEDTIFSYNLYKIKASIKHIDNPVLHGDVDLNTVYLNKTKKGLENLNFIYKNDLIDPDFVTFLKLFKKIKLFKLNYGLALINRLFYSILEYNLTSNNPSIYVFDLFRLSYFCDINLKK